MTRLIEPKYVWLLEIRRQDCNWQLYSMIVFPSEDEACGAKRYCCESHGLDPCSIRVKRYKRCKRE